MGDEVGYRNDSASKKVFTHYPVMRSLLCSPVCPLVLSISRNQNGVLYQTSIEHLITVSRLKDFGLKYGLTRNPGRSAVEAYIR